MSDELDLRETLRAFVAASTRDDEQRHLCCDLADLAIREHMTLIRRVLAGTVPRAEELAAHQRNIRRVLDQVTDFRGRLPEAEAAMATMREHASTLLAE